MRQSEGVAKLVEAGQVDDAFAKQKVGGGAVGNRFAERVQIRPDLPRPRGVR